MTERIRESFERIEALLTSEPERGRDTAVTEIRLSDGLRCDVREGPWSLVADMAENVGGAASGPTPGVFGRAALGSCLAIGYKMWAAKLGVDLQEIHVRIEADFDSGALFGVSDVPAGYGEVRYAVTVRTSETEKEVRRVLDEADRHSPYFDVFSRAQSLVRRTTVLAPDAPAAAE